MTDQNFQMYIPYIERALDKAIWFPGHTPIPERLKPHYVGYFEGSKALRLDWELTYEQAEKWDISQFFPDLLHPRVKKAIIEAAASDIADLVVNGDTNSTDPLLKNFDGEVKLGKRFAGLRVSSVHWQGENQQRKETVEYTMYLRAGPVLEEDS